MKTSKLNELEKKYIEDNCGEMSVSNISEVLGVAYGVVYRYTQTIGVEIVRVKNKFTEEQDKFIIENYMNKTGKYIAEELGMTLKRVEKHIEVLTKAGLLESKRRVKRRAKKKVSSSSTKPMGLSDREKQFIKNERDKYSLKELSNIIGVNQSTVSNFCFRNNIEKSS